MDVLRLAGASGVGKSTTAWAVARRLAAEGVATGYVDIDQLGMCYPAPDDDPDRWALKERVLSSIADEFRHRGVDRLVVSGVAWPDDPPPQISGAAVRSLWLDASEQTRRSRLEVRRLSEEQRDQFLSAGSAEARRVHRAWERIDTDDLSEADTIALVLARWQPPALGERTADVRLQRHSAASSGDRVLWITGPRLAGASRVGWQVAGAERAEGRRTGFIDLAQLSFAWNNNSNSVAVGLANLASLHREFRAAGTVRFVIVAPLEVAPAAVRAALPTSEVSFVRLLSSASNIRRHALLRRQGDGGVVAGDDLFGASEAEIDRILGVADSQSRLPIREHELSVSTSDLSLVAAEVAVRSAARW